MKIKHFYKKLIVIIKIPYRNGIEIIIFVEVMFKIYFFKFKILLGIISDLRLHSFKWTV